MNLLDKKRKRLMDEWQVSKILILYSKGIDFVHMLAQKKETKTNSNDMQSKNAGSLLPTVQTHGAHYGHTLWHCKEQRPLRGL